MSQTKQDKHLHDGWIRTSIIAGVVASLAIACYWYGVIIDEIAWSIAGVGIITFFGMLAISSYNSLHQPNSTGTLRKAIATSMITVYIVVLSLLFSGNLPILENQSSMTLMENFSYIIMTIIGFYFGSKGVNEFLKIWRGEKNGQTQ